MLHFSRLLGDGRGDPWIRVPVQIHPPRRNSIENFPSVGRIQIDALGSHHAQRRRIKRGVRKRVPDTQRRSHRRDLLGESGAVEVVQENLHERGAVEIRQARNFADHSDVTEALDRLAIFTVLIPDQDDPVHL